MTDAEIPSAPAPAPAAETGWQPLPRRGAWLAALGGAAAMLPPLAVVAGVFTLATGIGSPWLAVPLCALLGAIAGAWLALKRHRLTRWRLDAQGLALARGRWWQTDTRVPLSRVQHLDLRRGPLERAAGLATLVVHTAGTRLNTVAISGLDDADAERLRDRLARQLDQDDDAL